MNYIGEIRIYAGNFAPRGWEFCDGRVLAISENEALFELIGTTYGGNESNGAFALPNLQGRSPQHKGQDNRLGAIGPLDLSYSYVQPMNSQAAMSAVPGYLALSFIIALEGQYPEADSGGDTEPFLAEGRLFAFDFAPHGWAQCNGQKLPINQYQPLFSLLGTTYGGNGQTNFALPDLRDSVPMHTRVGEFLERKRTPSPGESGIDFLVLNSCIALTGIFPPTY